MDLVRAIDFVCSRPEVNNQKIAVEGGSQGGAFSLVACALDKRIKVAAPHIPFLTDFRDYFKICPWPKSSFEHYLKKNPDKTWDDIYGLLAYFDVKNFAPRIQCPIVMGIGLQDNTCPPHTNFASYNLIPSEKKYYVYRLGLSLASGASLASAFAPANTPLFALAALILIFYIVGVTEKVSHAVLWGMAFGFGWFVTGISWVYYSMYHYGYMLLEWTYVTTCVFSLALALFPTVAFALVVKFVSNPIVRMALALPAAFTLLEWVRGWLLTGFPWLNPAYAIVDWPLAGLAPFIGSFGVLLGLVWIAGLIGAIWALKG